MPTQTVAKTTRGRGRESLPASITEVISTTPAGVEGNNTTVKSNNETTDSNSNKKISTKNQTLSKESVEKDKAEAEDSTEAKTKARRGKTKQLSVESSSTSSKSETVHKNKVGTILNEETDINEIKCDSERTSTVTGPRSRATRNSLEKPKTVVASVDEGKETRKSGRGGNKNKSDSVSETSACETVAKEQPTGRTSRRTKGGSISDNNSHDTTNSCETKKEISSEQSKTSEVSSSKRISRTSAKKSDSQNTEESEEKSKPSRRLQRNTNATDSQSSLKETSAKDSQQTEESEEQSKPPSSRRLQRNNAKATDSQSSLEDLKTAVKDPKSVGSKSLKNDNVTECDDLNISGFSKRKGRNSKVSLEPDVKETSSQSSTSGNENVVVARGRGRISKRNTEPISKETILKADKETTVEKGRGRKRTTDILSTETTDVSGIVEPDIKVDATTKKRGREPDSSQVLFVPFLSRT